MVSADCQKRFRAIDTSGCFIYFSAFSDLGCFGLAFKIFIKGIVQGVGFRPYIFRIAKKFGIVGRIQNQGNQGVSIVGRFFAIDSEQERDFLNKFVEAVHANKPDISFIESIEATIISDELIESQTLEILPSVTQSDLAKGLVLPPDVGICDKCLEDFWNPENPRYYKYPFIACAECGPRFSTVRALPYDRERTTMDVFPLCGNPLNLEKDSCLYEYLDANNRRFHAQTFSCSKCGPQYVESVSIASSFIQQGKIIAVKGVGGVHLVCSALNTNAIGLLRSRKKKRQFKPFAIMYPSIKELVESKQFIISDYEKQLLQSFRRPIVLLKKSKSYNLPESIAPGLPNVGVMLPYAGIHYLLFSEIGNIPLVYTSGNPSNIPMAIKNEEIKEMLSGIVDSFLLHNRDIYQRIDDSVLRVVCNKLTFIRRSRGYVPEYVPLPFHTDDVLMACGGEENSTGAVLCNSRIFQTQHIGTITTQETRDFLQQAIFHLIQLLGIDPKSISAVGHDLHPSFLSNDLAKEFNIRYHSDLHQIQHHHAHHASLMIDSKCSLEEKICSIAVDGVGFGSDGTSWGGEVLVGSYDSVERMGGLFRVPMIGGDRCAIYPARMLACFLLSGISKDEASVLLETWNVKNHLEFKEKELEYIIDQFDDIGKLKSDHLLCSSAGRFLDAVASLLDICQYRTYRGEPAMRLEGFAIDGLNIAGFDIEKFIEGSTLRTDNIIKTIATNYLSNYPKKDIAYTILYQLGKGLMLIALKVCKTRGVCKIGCTGGVAINEIFMEGAMDAFEEHRMDGLEFLQHERVAPGDAGISIGQIGVMAAKRALKKTYA